MFHTVCVCDMHTGGEPLRIIETVQPPLSLEGKTVLEKRRFFKDNFDDLRKFVIQEPRGHRDMYAAYVIRPACHPQADFSVLFMHNEGYSTMCGHAVIALAKYAVRNKWVDVHAAEAQVKIECPCGLVVANVNLTDGNEDYVKFTSVPSFLFDSYDKFEFEGSLLHFDIVYGGAFYAIIEESVLNVSICSDPIDKLVSVASSLKKSIKDKTELSHPESIDLAFLYGIIITDGRDDNTKNLCIFADGEVDRSPTGSGVTARVAQQFAKGSFGLGDARKTFINSKTLSEMTGKVAEVIEDYHGRRAVRVEVGGEAFFTGHSQFFFEDKDQFKYGFIIT